MEKSTYDSRFTIHGSREKGFTLIELLIVVALVAILSAIAFPNFQEMLIKIRVNGAVKGVAMEISLTKVRAISENRSYWIEFEPSGTQYKVYADLDRDKTKDVNEVVKTIDLSQGIKFGTAAGVKKVGQTDLVPDDGVTFGGTGNYVDFGSDGRSSNTGAVYLIPSVDSSSGRKDRMRAITLSLPTYKVKVYRHTGITWVGF